MTQDKPTPAREPGFYWFHDNGELTVVQAREDGSVIMLGTEQRWDQDQHQICRNERDQWGNRIPTPAAPAETDKLLALARKCDETADLEAKLVAGEELRSLLGDRYEEFDKRYGALVERLGAEYLWPAEAVARTLGLVQDGNPDCISSDRPRRKEGAFGLLRCGCAFRLTDGLTKLGRMLCVDCGQPAPALVPADAVKVWLEVAKEALRPDPADLTIDAESNLRAALQRLVEMMRERLPAQARAE